MEYIRSGHYDIVRNDYGRQMVIPSEREWTEVKRGRWITDGVLPTTCSECGHIWEGFRFRGGNFCPNCGAKMDKE